MRAWRVCIAVAAGIVLGSATHRQSSVEQTIGGISVGDSLAKARQAFPGLRPQGGDVSEVWTANVGGCEVTVSASAPMRDTDPVETIGLDRLSDRELGACANLRTGRGLGIADNPKRVGVLYGLRPTRPDYAKKISYRQDDSENCERHKSRIMRSFFVICSESGTRIDSLIVDGSEASCNDFLAGRHDHDKLPTHQR